LLRNVGLSIQNLLYAQLLFRGFAGSCERAPLQEYFPRPAQLRKCWLTGQIGVEAEVFHSNFPPSFSFTNHLHYRAVHITFRVSSLRVAVASAKSDEGEQLFPRKWDSEFMDLPIVKNQRQPTFTPDTVSAIVKNSTGQDRMLYALLAGSGLRVGEALGLELQHISEDFRTVFVRQTESGGMRCAQTATTLCR
jgi:hypothetical protein